MAQTQRSLSFILRTKRTVSVIAAGDSLQSINVVAEELAAALAGACTKVRDRSCAKCAGP
jgi:hypothetical protein